MSDRIQEEYLRVHGNINEAESTLNMWGVNGYKVAWYNEAAGYFWAMLTRTMVIRG